jgi:hypothetical protein
VAVVAIIFVRFAKVAYWCGNSGRVGVSDCVGAKFGRPT